MGVEFYVDLYGTHENAQEYYVDTTTIDVLHNERIVDELDETTYVVEVYKHPGEALEVSREVSFTEVVKPGGTIVNVGAGPQLPIDPYEGQIWIRT